MEKNLVVEFEKEETITLHNGNCKRKIVPGTRDILMKVAATIKGMSSSFSI